MLVRSGTNQHRYRDGRPSSSDVHGGRVTLAETASDLHEVCNAGHSMISDARDDVVPLDPCRLRRASFDERLHEYARTTRQS